MSLTAVLYEAQWVLHCWCKSLKGYMLECTCTWGGDGISLGLALI